ncbi:hypothetical protein ASAC_0697 [Acidilobus saccharovorans 345-15]|uniref:Uncharacterized protein n=1 Tax=Acidilobus saccharovorans (strain DSM 16705 / JCM 18335 / VKM B-2471 / 345-15) TaxID=666510 RepID=D9Q1B5_ACIS3|nr:hypothetical protein [Acidilobus saccharovorans]ADL19103.1 hypothetical protein ASAC_0697 [Acidilobus saccharovorans 345-15]
MKGYLKVAMLASLLAVALAAPMAAAHIIFVYKEQVNFNAVTPVLFKPGPEAAAVQLSLYNVTGKTGQSGAFIQLTIPVTNATYEYVYQALELYVNNAFGQGTPELSVASCSYTGSATLTSVTLVVYPTTDSSPGQGQNITITPSTSACTASGTATLTQGTTYYVDFKVLPTIPVPYGSSGTLTLYLEVENVTSS